MPTSRPRHMLTETDELAAALEDAARAWPDLRGDRGALLRRLIAVGHESVRGTDIHVLVANASGAATGTYPRDARAELLAEWPE